MQYSNSRFIEIVLTWVIAGVEESIKTYKLLEGTFPVPLLRCCEAVLINAL